MGEKGGAVGVGSVAEEDGGLWAQVRTELDGRPLFRRLLQGGQGTERRRLGPDGLLLSLRSGGEKAALLRLPVPPPLY